VKLVGYLRVSTNGQVKDGYGLPVQRREIQEWAKRSGHKVDAWYSDEGVSGAKDASEREGLAAALQDVCNGHAEGLVTAKLDRFARSLTVQEAALAHVWRCGGQVFTADQGEILRDDPDDPMRSAMRQMSGVFAQLERAMIVKRLRNGRRYKAGRGGYAHGAPRYGYRAEEGALVSDLEEQRSLERMVELRAEGRSLRDIATMLTDEGHKPRRSERWHANSIRQILQRLNSE
jgi:DNA invertase Pin-like site-specific DNA recombinase